MKLYYTLNRDDVRVYKVVDSNITKVGTFTIFVSYTTSESIRKVIAEMLGLNYEEFELERL